MSGGQGRVGRFVAAATIVVGLFYLVGGVWLLVGPHSFFDTLAVFRPYSRHFLHDAGAFQIGLGVTVLLALRISDALLVVLTGASVGAWFHVAAHVMDRHIGGRPSTDIPGLVALALLGSAAAVARAVTRSSPRSREERASSEAGG